MTLKEKALKLKNDGCTLKEIAKNLKLEYHHVTHLLYYNHKEKDELNFDKILDLWRSGKNPQQIGNKLGVPGYKIRYQLAKRGLVN